MPFELLNPKGLERPVGYAHVAKVTGGSIVYVAGQAPFDENGSSRGQGGLRRAVRPGHTESKDGGRSSGGTSGPICCTDDLYHRPASLP